MWLKAQASYVHCILWSIKLHVLKEEYIPGTGRQELLRDSGLNVRHDELKILYTCVTQAVPSYFGCLRQECLRSVADLKSATGLGTTVGTRNQNTH